MPARAEKLMRIVVAAAEDKKAHDIIALNLSGISMVADYFVICHGNSDTQVQAITTEIGKQAEASGIRVKGTEGMDSGRWVLIDIGDVVVHVFHREEREYYSIERLWSDAKVVEFA